MDTDNMILYLCVFLPVIPSHYFLYCVLYPYLNTCLYACLSFSVQNIPESLFRHILYNPCFNSVFEACIPLTQWFPTTLVEVRDLFWKLLFIYCKKKNVFVYAALKGRTIKYSSNRWQPKAIEPTRRETSCIFLQFLRVYQCSTKQAPVSQWVGKLRVNRNKKIILIL